ncbi:MAG: SDR family NAD(P)-dependent oxidoreductase [Piscinibacter sp.]|nr:SDR family NAD(P)-dependent oxidoreductase [Piscinibacter sp.]
MVEGGAPVAVVVGAGTGLGAALVRRFATAGMQVAAASRRGCVPDAIGRGSAVRGFACDATDALQVDTLFTQVGAQMGPPELVVFNVGTWQRAGIAELTGAVFEDAWRQGCFGGFVVGRAAARAMRPHGRGSILFTGATGSLRGSAGFAAFAVAKFGLRALAQSMARELGPQGLHVAHVVVDGMIATGDDPGEEGRMRPEDIAQAYLQLHLQPRSAWTHELDLRPAQERF